jgi:hypothetical protein
MYSNSRRTSNLSLSAASFGEIFTVVVSERVEVKTDKDGNTVQYFNLYAKSGDKNYPKISRTYRDFKSLEVALTNNLRGVDIDCPQLESGAWSSSHEDNIPLNDKLNNIKRFCRIIASDINFHIEPFYDFFKIPKPRDEEAGDGIQGRASDLDLLCHDKEDKGKRHDTMFDQNKEYCEFERASTLDYCIHFKSTLAGPPIEKEDPGELNKKPHNYYQFNISPISEPHKVTVLEKRYSEFCHLALQLKADVKARAPPLPAKIMLKDKVSLQKRGEALDEWLMTIINDKLFYCTELFEFLNMDSGAMTHHSNMDLVTILLEQFKFKFTFQDKKAITAADESFVLWEVKVNVYENITNDLVDSYTIFRRFKEFDHLHKGLKQKFAKFMKPLPELPEKLGYLKLLGAKNDQRQMKLESYLQALCEYPGMFHTINFRKFIELDTSKIDSFLSKTKSRRLGHSL